MITKRTGNGQTICKGCKDKGKFGLTWDSWLYNFNNEPYCFECLMEKLEELQERINKAIEYCKDYSCWTGEDGDLYESDFCIDDILEILKGE